MSTTLAPNPALAPDTLLPDEGIPDGEELGEPTPSDGEMPPIFGRCPVCNKPLFPRCKFTGEMKAPPVGKGYDSRAKCGGCGTIIYYKGGGEWGVLLTSDMDEDEIMADKLGID